MDKAVRFIEPILEGSRCVCCGKALELQKKNPHKYYCSRKCQKKSRRRGNLIRRRTKIGRCFSPSLNERWDKIMSTALGWLKLRRLMTTNQEGVTA